MSDSESGAGARAWHISPAVDLAAYAFSWVFVLVPLVLLPARGYQVLLLLIVVGLTFLHRHFTLPYVYLDRAVFDRFPRRFTWFPLAMLAAFLVTPWLWSTRARLVVAAVVFAAGAWNVWHVYMQKYGILRMYAAKSKGEREHRRYVDRLLLLCWVPLYLVWLGPSYEGAIARSFPTVEAIALPLIAVLRKAQPVLLVPAIALVVAALGLFAFEEHRASGLGNRPRLGMALGTSMLSASFLFLDPVRVFLAFAFSHAVEYLVFVWAFQRRRYARKLEHDPLLGRWLERPVLVYTVFGLGITLPYLCARFYGYAVVPDAEPPVLLGTTVERWAFYWSVYQSLVHFYYDGFLWKMRAPAVRAHL